MPSSRPETSQRASSCWERSTPKAPAAPRFDPRFYADQGVQFSEGGTVLRYEIDLTVPDDAKIVIDPTAAGEPVVDRFTVAGSRVSGEPPYDSEQLGDRT